MLNCTEMSVKKEDLLQNIFYLACKNTEYNLENNLNLNSNLNTSSNNLIQWGITDLPCFDSHIKKFILSILKYNIKYNLRELQAFIWYNFNIKKKQKFVENLMDNFYYTLNYKFPKVLENNNFSPDYKLYLYL